MATAFLLNPPRRRKSRKARKSRGRARRHNVSHRRRGSRRRRSRNMAGWFKRRGKRWGRRGLKRTIRGRRRFSRPTRKTYRRRRKLARASNPPRRHSRRRGGRRRNPGGIMGLSFAVPEVIPFRLPLPGILGTIGNGIIQAAAAGGIMFAGYVVSGKIVDFVEENVLPARPLGAWQRPVLFGAIAGAVGGIVSYLAPAGKKLQWSLLAASGPGIRAFAGIVANLIPAGQTGIVADIRGAAGQLADYIQVGDLYEAGLGEGNDAMDAAYGEITDEMGDYLQVGDLYEAGLGAEQEVVGM